jgi:hypothetical protein
LDSFLRRFISWHQIPQTIREMVMHFLEPKYDSDNLKEAIKECLRKEPRISETITNVIIPTFDIKRFRPIIFSTLKVILFLEFLMISYSFSWISNDFIPVFLTYLSKGYLIFFF